MTTTLQHTSKLPAVSPFDLRQAARALDGFAPCAGEQRIADGTVRKALALPEASAVGTGPGGTGSRGASSGAVVVEVGPRGDGRAGISLAVFAERPLTAPQVRTVERSVSDWLGLSDDMTGFLAVAAADRAIAPVLTELAGLHQVRFASLTEGATYFVLAQRTSQRVAAVRKRRLAQAFGPALTLDGDRYVAFPALEQLIQLHPDQLGRYTANLRQTEYLTCLLHALAELDPDWLHTAPYDEVVTELRRIRGVGEFTASALMLRVLGRPDRLPLHLPQFGDLVTRLYGPDTCLDDIAERYGRYLGWWGYYAKTALALQTAPGARTRVA